MPPVPHLRYRCRTLLDRGLRPRICVVKYNSALGPHRLLTIEYLQDFDFRRAHSTQLYYGVSLAGWRKLFEGCGYQFVTVERNGVNAFFVDVKYFDGEFLAQVQGLEFVGNRCQDGNSRFSTTRSLRLLPTGSSWKCERSPWLSICLPVYNFGHGRAGKRESCRDAHA